MKVVSMCKFWPNCRIFASCVASAWACSSSSSCCFRLSQRNFRKLTCCLKEDTRSSKLAFLVSNSCIFALPKAWTSVIRSNFVAISSSYRFIFTSICSSSWLIFTSRLSILSSSPCLFISSASSLVCVLSEFCSCLFLNSSSSSTSRMWPSGLTVSARVSEIFSSRRWMFCCFSSSFFSSSALRPSNSFMKRVISWSFVKRISFCWSA
mmetsp:Transcript_120620/g.335900  ORF Transcript_120620/g.335900 Transcript_120620/m.335900 type:complete len:208 (+) Transcript_120620:335-958(+)